MRANVPVRGCGRPDITDGRVSLVIFFYPDADNLERQWQTINEDDEEEKSITDVGCSFVVDC